MKEMTTSSNQYRRGYPSTLEEEWRFELDVPTHASEMPCVCGLRENFTKQSLILNSRTLELKILIVIGYNPCGTDEGDGDEQTSSTPPHALRESIQVSTRSKGGETKRLNLEPLDITGKALANR